MKTLLNESSLSRIHHHSKTRNIGIITAYINRDPETGDPVTEKENIKRNLELQTDLENHIRRKGYGYVHVEGHYVEGKNTPNEQPPSIEHSYYVIGKEGDDSNDLLNTLKHLGKKHGQESILFKPYNEENAYLHGTREGGWPGLDQTVKLDKFHPRQIGEFATVLLNRQKTQKFSHPELKETFNNPNDVILVEDLFLEKLEFLLPVSFSNRTKYRLGEIG